MIVNIIENVYRNKNLNNNLEMNWVMPPKYLFLYPSSTMRKWVWSWFRGTLALLRISTLELYLIVVQMVRYKQKEKRNRLHSLNFVKFPRNFVNKILVTMNITPITYSNTFQSSSHSCSFLNNTAMRLAIDHNNKQLINGERDLPPHWV